MKNQNISLKEKMKKRMINPVSLQENNEREKRNPEGIFFLGHDGEGSELWLDRKDMTSHVQIFGDAGSERRIALESLLANAFSLGTGLCHIDSMNDINMGFGLFLMARRVSREDDFLLLNFAENDRRTVDKPFRNGNTVNIFEGSAADQAVMTILNFSPKDDERGVNSVFHRKAHAIMTSLVPVLARLEDAEQMLPLTEMGQVKGFSCSKGCLGTGINPRTICAYLSPTAAVSLVYPLKGATRHIEPNNASPIADEWEECDAVAKFVEPELLDTLKSALIGLSYNPFGKHPLEQQAYRDQFVYANSYFGTPLSSITGKYKDIMNVFHGEIDFHDVIYGRRILAAFLPSLERTPQECELLGKIVLSGIRNAIARGARLDMEEKNEKTRCFQSDVPPAIMAVDDYSTIMLPRFDLVLSQGRGQNIMGIISDNDCLATRETGSENYSRIFANIKTKLFMKTFSVEKFLKELQNLFRENTLDVTELMKQDEMEFHCFFEGEIIKGKIPYLVPEADRHMKFRLNRFIPINHNRNHIMENTEKWMAAGQQALKSLDQANK